MNAENVFIGVTKNNDEVLLYFDMINKKIINLQTNQEVDVSSLEENSLIPYTSLNKKNRQFKNMIIRRYENDRKQALNIEEIFIGDIYQTEEIYCKCVLNPDLPLLYQGLKYQHVMNLIKKSALLYRIKSNGFVLATSGKNKLYDGIFLDLEINDMYNNDDYDNIGGIFVRANMKPYLSVFKFDKMKEEKKMILKKYRERRK